MRAKTPIRRRSIRLQRKATQTEGEVMLNTKPIAATIPAKDLAKSRKFYEQTLGFKPKQESPGGIFYAAGDGTIFSLYQTQFSGTGQHTLACWNVSNLEQEMDDLRKNGVKFEEYDLPGLKTNK